MRKALTIAAIVIVLVGIAVGVYFLFFANDSASLQVGGGQVTNPFGTAGSGTNTVPNTAAPTNPSNESPTAVAAQPSPRLVEIAKGPIAEGIAAVRVTIPGTAAPAGSTSSSTAASGAATTTDTEIRYIERASGNIYTYRVHAGTLTRTSNRTIPGVQQAAWLPDGSTAYVRFISTASDGTMHIEGYALPASGVGGFALPQDSAQVIPAGTSTILTLSSGTNGSIATLSRADGSAAKTAFSSLLGQLTVFATRGDYFAMTKPSAQMQGYAFAVDAKTGSFTRILGPYAGLSVLPSHSGTKVLFSYVNDGSLHLAFYDTATKQIGALPVTTLAEKCVWSPDDLSAYCAVPVSLPSVSLPDAWYQGAASFSDRIWQIDFSLRVAELAANLPSLAKTTIDATALSIDPAQDVITFINKQDGSIWSYDL